MANAPNTNGESQAVRRARVWQSMRILRVFTAADLIATASVSTSVVYRYIKVLAEAGYIECVREHKTGPQGKCSTIGPRHGVWKLVRDTGPFAPNGKQHGDPNLDPTRRSTHISIPKDEYQRALKCVRACAGMADPEAEIAALKIRAEGTQA